MRVPSLHAWLNRSRALEAVRDDAAAAATAAPATAADIPATQRLQFRAVIVVLTLILLTVGTSGWLLERLIQHELNQMLHRTTVKLGAHVAERFAEPLERDDERLLTDAMLAAMDDVQLAFVAVERRTGELWSYQAESPSLWGRYRYLESQSRGLGSGSLLSRPTPLGDPQAPEAVALRTPVFSTPDARSDAPPELVGYVVLGVVDPIHRAAVEQVRASAMGVVCVVCLVAVPITVLLIRRLTRPLRKIVRAIDALAMGGELPPLPVRRSDEIGALARSFTDTAARLALARDQLLAANANLERQVAQRTLELSRLTVRLQREIDTKNEFLRTVSHDLNAPLRNIAGMTAMIQQRFGSQLPEEVAKRLERIAANVQLESGMLDDLLELSRLRTRPGQPEDVNLDELLAQIVGALGHELSERRIECTAAPGLPVLHVERNLARQVFQNLIDNAIKYMGDRPVRRIEIASDVDATEDVVRIRVKDTGPGIAEADREKIFQVFRRGSDPGTAAIPGRGIGLPSVRAVVERWSGSLTVESEVGEGSTFIVTLPTDRIADAARAASDRPAAGAALSRTAA